MISLSPAMFERQMAYLAAGGFRSMPLGGLCRALASGESLPKKTVALTFDDGYRNTLRVAVPVLQRFGFTATVFAVTGYVGQRMTWTQSEVASDLELATWDELRCMVDEGLDVQAHTVTHPNLAELPPERVRQEAGDSKAELESRLGKPVTMLAYPYGEFTSGVEAVLGELGFIGAVTLQPAAVRPGHRPLALPRWNVNTVCGVGDMTQMRFFRCCVHGTACCYAGMKRLLPVLVWRHRPWEGKDQGQRSGRMDA